MLQAQLMCVNLCLCVVWEIDENIGWYGVCRADIRRIFGIGWVLWG